MQKFLGIKNPSIIVETSLHLGTMLAIFFVFWNDITKLVTSIFNISNKSEEAKIYRRFALLIVFGTVPAAIIGLLFETQIEQLFENALFVGFALLVTATLLLLSKRLGGEKTLSNLSIADALFIGAGQAFAILPGISRSGSTIVAALFRNVEPQTAARFSLILSIPAIIGANGIALKSTSIENSYPFLLAFGALVSFITGVAAIKLLLKALSSKRLSVFAFWCIAVGLATILLETTF